MITAVDTNILLDVLLPDPSFGPDSLRMLGEFSQKGALIISEIVFSELASVFKDLALLESTLGKMGIRLERSKEATLFKAGVLWRNYRKHVRGETKSNRVLADFLVGAHALLQADRFLSRDRGFYRMYFHGLKIVPID